MPNFEKFKSDKATLAFPITLVDVTGSADVVTAYPLNFAGRITGFRFVTDHAVTTGGKTVAFNLEVNSTNLTGGIVTLTSATATPKGKIIEATTITANNGFNAGDTLSVEATVTVAFAEGTGTFEVDVEYL
jgi:hypothetical protein